MTAGVIKLFNQSKGCKESSNKTCQLLFHYHLFCLLSSILLFFATSNCSLSAAIDTLQVFHYDDKETILGKFSLVPFNFKQYKINQVYTSAFWCDHLCQSQQHYSLLSSTGVSWSLNSLLLLDALWLLYDFFVLSFIYSLFFYSHFSNFSGSWLYLLYSSYILYLMSWLLASVFPSTSSPCVFPPVKDTHVQCFSSHWNSFTVLFW